MSSWVQAFMLATVAGILFVLVPVAGGLAGSIIGVGLGLLVLKHILEYDEETENKND